MEVKRKEHLGGNTINKVSWTLYDDNGKEIGSLGEPHMYEIGGLCTSGYIVRKWAGPIEIYATMQDAVTKGLGVTGTWEEIDAVCELFFQQDYHLAPCYDLRDFYKST